MEPLSRIIYIGFNEYKLTARFFSTCFSLKIIGNFTKNWKGYEMYSFCPDYQQMGSFYISKLFVESFIKSEDQIETQFSYAGHFCDDNRVLNFSIKDNISQESMQFIFKLFLNTPKLHVNIPVTQMLAFDPNFDGDEMTIKL